MEISKKWKIDYYIYIDYSHDLIGYNIIENKNIGLLLTKISKFEHYKKVRHVRTYLIKIKKIVKKDEISGLLHKQKIRYLKDNISIFVEVIEFVKKHDNCAIFLSVDNNQYAAFTKLIELVPHKEHLVLVRESDLKKGSVEYKLSLIIDNMLVIERMSK
ncbi:hypothetical protein HYV80_00870 [Candidatus Woesearchaeota archaeon]|nr:hypothetical protein [Candidatus Woesearchaeota archaeon]